MIKWDAKKPDDLVLNEPQEENVLGDLLDDSEAVKTSDDMLDYLLSEDVEEVEEEQHVEEEETEEEEKPKEEKKKEKEKKAAPKIDIQELLEEGEEVSEEEEGEEEENIFRGSATYLADKFGVELPEDVETWDENTFPDFLERLADYRANERYESFKNSNEVAAALLDVIEKGGDSSNLISLFKEQKEFHDMDESTPEAKLQKIAFYYKEVEGKDTNWIKKRILNPLSSEDSLDELEAEFQDVKKNHDKYVAEEKSREIAAVAAEKQRQEAFVAKQRNDFGEVLTKDVTLKGQNVKELVDFVYNEKALKVTGADGSTKIMSRFEYEIQKARHKPEDLKDLILFLRDKKAYQQKIITDAKSQAVEKKFDIKFPTKKKTDVIPKKQEDTKKQKVTFKF